MLSVTDDLRIQKTNELVSPESLLTDISLTEKASTTVSSPPLAAKP